MNRSWEDDIRRKLARQEEPAPMLSWDELDNALAERRMKRQAVRRSYRRVASAAAAVLVVAGAGIGYWLQDRDDMPAPPALNVQVAAPVCDEAVQPVQRLPQAHTVPSSSAPQARRAAPARTALPADSQSARPDEAVNQAGTGKKVEAEPAASPDRQSPSPAVSTPRRQYSHLALETEPFMPHNQVRKLSLVTYFSNGMASCDQTGRQPLLAATGGIYGGSERDELSNSNGVVMTPAYEEHRTVSHRLPVSVGLGASWQLSGRWQLSFGLSYTYLHTDITSTDGHTQRSTVQRLHYVGLPVSMNYTVWRGRQFRLYASGGVTAEKMVSGKADTQTAEGQQVTGSTSGTVRMKSLQWSLHASAGAEYQLARSIGIYAEPGIGYYIDNGSQVSTYYSDKPLGFRLNVGLRMNIR